MWIQVNKESNRIEGCIERCIGMPIVKNGCVLIEVDEVPYDWPFYKFLNGLFVLDEEYKEKVNEEKILRDIRNKREYECFSYINRGTLWYETLTDYQKIELKEWYQSWLDAPATLKVPKKPVWLI